MVINALTEKKEKTHVPYRDSKLTRLLQESLGGNSQTTLIVACSMCSYNDKETLSTLRFGIFFLKGVKILGSRAKNIKNTPIVNVERSAKELMALLENAEKRIKEQDEIIQNLQQQLDNAPSTGIIPSLDIAKKGIVTENCLIVKKKMRLQKPRIRPLKMKEIPHLRKRKLQPKHLHQQDQLH
jgi:Kinesin-like protein